MRKQKNVNGSFKKKIFSFGLIIAILFISLYFYIPENIKVLEGTKKYVSLGFPFKLKASDAILNACNISALPKGSDYNYVIEGKTQGQTNLKALIGFIPIKKVTVDVIPNTKLIPIGKTCGIRIFEDGVLVLKEGNIVDFIGIKESPSKGLIFEGDIIKKINNVVIENKKDLIREVNDSEGKEITVSVLRDGEEKKVTIKPEKENVTGNYKIGLWVRDSTQGIGTMTYYNPSSNTIGVLGHAIVDVDTGKSFNVRKGTLLRTDITYIKKGESGVPGEIMGIIYDGESYRYGNIIRNSENGIIAKINDETKKEVNLNDAIEIALSNEVKLGKANIMSNVIDNEVKYYEVEIEEINKYSYGNSKGMIIKITDEELINKTGGIVQGMSGSPIIQDGKLIGAVTHVFVQDPLKGFGIFIESMLEEEE